jgi:hypothetical protein
VTDEIRATVYGLVVQFVDSGRSDERQAAEWIHKAHRFGRRSRSRHPAIGFAAALERMLQAPGAALPAFEELLDHEDPWVRALARLHLGKMRIVPGRPGRPGRAGSGRVSRDGAHRVPGSPARPR